MAVNNKLPPAHLVAARFKAAGIPQDQLSDLIGKCPSAVARWKSDGGRIPNIASNGGESTYSQLIRLAKKRNVRLTLQELLTGGVL